MIAISFVFLVISLAGLLTVFFLYPFSLWILSLFFPKRHPKDQLRDVKVSIIVAVRNAEAIIEEKVRNCLTLDYSPEKLEIIFSLDGSTDRTAEIIKTHQNERVIVVSLPVHRGKAYALNLATHKATGEILLFSDADAILIKEALKKMIRYFADPDIGGVCGQRVIYKDIAEMKSAQRDYIKFDSSIKMLESRIGSITSNDGKLYCMRKHLFKPLDPAATDDLYSCLAVVKQHYRFVFEPEAKAFIRIPSRTLTHELLRRRRIVARSLRGIFLMREVLNPLKYDGYSIGLLINKVLRRMLPIFLLLLFLSSLILGFSNRWVRVFWLFQCAGYALALLYPLLKVLPRNPIIIKIERLSSLACYFSIGNLGTLLGLMDFLLGKKTEKWEPLKTRSR